jgi:anti-sigma factor ChrR (cupin superfamily)
VAATVKAEVIVGKTCTFGPSCGVVAAPQLGLSGREAEEHFDSNVNADAFDNIVVFVDGLRNDETATQTLVYTSKSSNLPSNIKSLTNNQILFVLTTTTTPPTSYQILVTITPK